MLDFKKPATIGTDMDYRQDSAPDPTTVAFQAHRGLEAQERKLTELSTRLARLERQHIQDDAATAEGKRLLGSLLVLIGRRLRNEDAKHN